MKRHARGGLAAKRIRLGSGLGLGLWLAMALTPPPCRAAAAADRNHWLGEEMPLPLSVRTPQDLEFKAAAERQYLLFNLLAGGKLAWDQGRYHEAAEKWEALIRLPRLDPDLAKLVRPLAEEARRRAGGAPVTPLPPPAVAEVPVKNDAVEKAAAPAPKPPASVAVSGSVTGGGSQGPVGAVLWLKRLDGPTPRPRPMKNVHMAQVDKTFVPHVLTVTVGTTVVFNNKDPIFHDVFSLDKPNQFDSGLFKGGSEYERVFRSPGAVQILCNIHASMLGYIVAVDSPWYAQVGRDGHFRLRDVPPGKYQLYAWHEAAASVSTTTLQVGEGGAQDVVVRVNGDARPSAFVPDKYGKPRQPQLGY
jgi:plastocyanin